jgi:hypothetical protein
MVIVGSFLFCALCDLFWPERVLESTALSALIAFHLTFLGLAAQA